MQVGRITDDGYPQYSTINDRDYLEDGRSFFAFIESLLICMPRRMAIMTRVMMATTRAIKLTTNSALISRPPFLREVIASSLKKIRENNRHRYGDPMRVLPRKTILADASNNTVTERQFLKKYE